MHTTTDTHSPFVSKLLGVASHWQGSEDALKALKEYLSELSDSVSLPQNPAQINAAHRELDGLIARAKEKNKG